MTDKPTPTDAELKAMWQLHAADIGGIFCYARAVLAKWGQPAQAGEAVAWMSPGKERLEFSRQDTVYGSHTIPLYTTPQPTQTQAGAVPMTPAQKQHIHNETGAGHALICLVESCVLEAHGITGDRA